VLTAALALVALPGLAGSRVTNPIEPIPASAFQQLTAPAKTRSIVSVGFDGAHVSGSPLLAGTPIVERSAPRDPGPTARLAIDQPDSGAGSARKPPRYTLTGGNGGCIERVVNDYGPVKPSRVVDLYRPDFFAICGCQWFAGITQVTVYVY
jgi:hypothetical protein